MQTIPLGQTGAEVSIFCFGGANIGSRIDEATSFQLLDQYAGAGGFFFDTANIYAAWLPGCAGGESETCLGNWLRRRSDRSRMFVATKVGFEMPGVERGLGAHQIETQCEKSLRRLGVETIDLYYAHVDDRLTPMEQTLAAFDRLIGTGKVRFVGASNFVSWRLEEARWLSQTHGGARYCCVQQHYSYLRRPRAIPNYEVTEDLLDYCRARGLTLLAYSPLLGGAYTRTDRPLPAKGYTGSDVEARLAVLRAVAEERGSTANQIVLAWLAQSDPPIVPLVAAGNPEQLQENLGALDIRLSAEEMTRLNGASS